LPALVCSLLDPRASRSFRAKTGRLELPSLNVATEGNTSMQRADRAGTLSRMTTAAQTRADFLTPKQVAHRLGVDVSSVYRSISRNELPHVRLLPRGAIRVPASAIEPEPRP
jgi:excisionase family DNA binding protein